MSKSKIPDTFYEQIDWTQKVPPKNKILLITTVEINKQITKHTKIAIFNGDYWESPAGGPIESDVICWKSLPMPDEYHLNIKWHNPVRKNRFQMIPVGKVRGL